MNPTDTSSFSHITMADTRLHSAACRLEPGPNYGRTEGEILWTGLDASFSRAIFSPLPPITDFYHPAPALHTSSHRSALLARPASTCRPASINGHPSPAATRTRRHHHLRFQLCSLVCFSSSVWTGGDDGLTMAPAARTEDMRARAAAAGRFEECVRELEAEKAKMEVFRRELPISVHLVADVIERLKDELAQQRRPAPELFAPAKRKAAPETDDKSTWMSSAQLWSCGGGLDDSTGNGNGSKKPAPHKVPDSSMPLNGLPAMLPRPTPDAAAETRLAVPLPDLSLSSPAIAGACPAAPQSATSSAVTDAGARQAQRKARRCWPPELHRRFVAALQRLGGAQAATPKQIRELMKVDGLTNDEVKSHLQKYRLHTRGAVSSDGGDEQAAMTLWSGPEQQYTTSQHSTSQSVSPQGPLQLTVSVTGGDSCDGAQDDEDGKSESYSWEMQQRGTKSSSS